MYIMPLSVPQKAGVIFYGLAIGVCAVVASMVAAVILGFLVVALFAVAHLAGNDGGGGFFVAEAAIYGFYVGTVVGAIVCWKVCKSRLRKVQTQ
jgi:membrane associated rhomboid family serine protease